MSKWVNIKDRKPKVRQKVLVARKGDLSPHIHTCDGFNGIPDSWYLESIDMQVPMCEADIWCAIPRVPQTESLT